MAWLSELRTELHESVVELLVEVRKNKFGDRDGALSAGAPCYSMADTDNDLSIALADGMVSGMIGTRRWRPARKGDKSGRRFQEVVASFLGASLRQLSPPGSRMNVIVPVQRGRPNRALPTEGDPSSTSTIANFEAYAHLLTIDELAREDGRIRAAFGGDYFVRPDVLVWRRPYRAADLDNGSFLDAGTTEMCRSPAVQESGQGNLLHASVSCKWTMRSDRAQNTRTEALNLLRHRKGRAPHICAVVMEPLPSRIASIAQGTGDVDCTYHVALHELLAAAQDLAERFPKKASSEFQLLVDLVDGRRLRDAADLPLDLLL